MSPGQRRLQAAGLLIGLLSAPLALLIAPPDAVQGQAQRLMYLHVPAAWCAYLCFIVVLAASLWQLVRGRDRSWAWARAGAEVGVALTVLTLITGSVWGGLTWGTWWVWDARIITTVAMGLVYVVFLAVHGLAAGPTSRRLTAGLGVLGFATVPVVHFSVLWWRTLHQPPTILAPRLDPPIEPLMAAALAAAVLTFTLLTVWALRQRVAGLLSGARSAPAPEPERPPTSEAAAPRELVRP